jgi:hypothetical protein
MENVRRKKTLTFMIKIKSVNVDKNKIVTTGKMFNG